MPARQSDHSKLNVETLDPIPVRKQMRRLSNETVETWRIIFCPNYFAARCRFGLFADFFFNTIPSMNGLAEIEAAVDQLPDAQQEALLDYLTSRVKLRNARVASPEERRIWMDELETFRNSVSRVPQTLSAEEIINDLRQE